jgi:hypothetical protein
MPCKSCEKHCEEFTGLRLMSVDIRGYAPDTPEKKPIEISVLISIGSFFAISF